MSAIRPKFASSSFVHLLQVKEAADLADLLNFPFYKFLVYSSEHHISHLVTVDWFVWGFALVLLLLPDDWQKPALYAMTGVSAVILVVCGAKLQSAVVHLAARWGGGGGRGEGGGGANRFMSRM